MRLPLRHCTQRRCRLLAIGPALVALSGCRGILGIEPLQAYRDAGSTTTDAPGGDGSHPDASVRDARARDVSTGDARLRDASAGDARLRDVSAGDAGSPFQVVNGVATGETLTAIVGWDADHFVAVGTSQVAYVYTSGNLQRAGGTAGGYDYNAVWGTGPDDVFAVGSVTGSDGGDVGGFVGHFDGTAWNVVFSSPTGLYGVWGTPEDKVIVVGDNGLMYGWFPGSSWVQIQQLPNPDDSGAPPPTLTSISGRSLSDFTITTSNPLFFHFEPDAGGMAYYEPETSPLTSFTFAWQLPNAPETSVYLGSNFLGLYWFTAPDVPTDASILPPGNGYELAMILLDEQAPGAQTMAIRGIWGTPGKVVAVGDMGRIYTYDLATTTPARVPGPSNTQQSFNGVWGSALDDVWIVGENELILHGAL
jgi:hypothetical protein